ncbi:MAG: hypothetical protein JWM98_2206 [Thermoleophilia bacterium]|nr:hypothetical protein [Thermoleophilia bacterium]
MKISKRTIAIGVSCAALGSLGGGYAIAAGTSGGSGSSAAPTKDSEEDGHEGRDEALTGATLKQASEAALAKVGEGKVTQSDKGDGGAAYEIEVTKADGSQVDVELDAKFGVTATKADGHEGADDGEKGGDEGEQGGDEGDHGDGGGTALTGATLSKASAAALAKVGSGTVTRTEAGDDGEAAYEVEVTKADGSQVDVELDTAFAVTAAKADTPEAGDQAD